ncbi:unnamed protein product, partial [marine sediment metagenome]
MATYDLHIIAFTFCPICHQEVRAGEFGYNPEEVSKVTAYMEGAMPFEVT